MSGCNQRKLRKEFLSVNPKERPQWLLDHRKELVDQDDD